MNRSKGLDATHGPAVCAGSVARGLDSVNRAIRDGCKIHGITLGDVATDGESIEIKVRTLGLDYTIVIVPGTLDAPDAPAIIRRGEAGEPDILPALALFDGDACGDGPRALAVGHGFDFVDPTD